MEILTDKYKIKIRSLEELGYKPKYKVDRKDEENKHTYTVDGWETFYVGVSSVLNIKAKEFLVPWAAREAALRTAQLLKKMRDKYEKILFKPGVYEFDQQKIKKIFVQLTSSRIIDQVTQWGKVAYRKKKDSAADIGSRAHKALDDIALGLTPNITEDIRYPVEGFLDWMKKTHLTLISGDIKVASIIEEYGGSCDALFIDEKNQLVLADYKTSNQFSDDYICQIGAYSNALYETLGLKTLPPAFIIRFDKNKPVVEIRGIRYINEAYKCFQSLLWAYRLCQIDYWDDVQQWVYKPTKEKIKK